MGRIVLLFFILLGGPVQGAVPEDPFGSPMWEYNLNRYLGEGREVVLDERVVLTVPPFAEDSAQVPLTLDLSGFPGEVDEIVTWIDLNPIPHLFTLTPGATPTRLISLNFRVQQATTVRAAVRDRHGVWHIGSAYVDAAGGGCTAPSLTAANPDWESNFGTIRGGAFSQVPGVRYKFSVMHPMDSGMVGDVPAFHIESVRLAVPGADEPLLSMTLSQSAAENPMFVFELERQPAGAMLWLRDNNGNVFERRLGGGA
ncbi:MAG: quinoprotein dehydrogenase-associated SoxYZ-like carrier [Marinobacter sp.]|uniref:quinoprotein dehydrogenase-associated SoxYZ-like carrier n=1 Tax=Marinobacter sp. TaxID=50741 RepID=UPI00299E0834|nr:quinoprotein dehydrogenase-associated SoxYZ-like carrier [Marinobacter sp.]MDX1756814.1 quinoprotein dehydrogenase-associated SoxYZ-like carrier [Marinobacter sp.]